MREIGGYMELDRYHLPMLHESALALNCGRNTLKHLIECTGFSPEKVQSLAAML